MDEARAIYQGVLDAISQAMWSGDDAGVLAHLALPNRMGARDDMRLFETPDTLLDTVRRFRQGLVAMGVRDFHRICNKADFDPANAERITGNHTTHLLAGGTYVLEPILNEMTLIRRGGKWLGAENRSLVESDHYSVINLAHRRSDGPQTT